MPFSIDVIIPSFRLNPENILPILNLQRPANATVRFYLVADNPQLKPDAAIAQLVNGDTVNLLINPQNMGASATRNRGIEAGNGDWVLFLDDDIVVNANLLITYANAAEHHPHEIGFIGLVTMPPPATPFAKAVDVNGSMGIFSAALHNEYYPWGASANIMIRRNALGDVRFSSAYPKTGGGEEVEFFFKIREQNNLNNYRCLPAAKAEHPWWKNGQADYTRFYRYGLGNSHLAQRNPAYRWYDFLNTPESILIVALLTFAIHFFWMPVVKFGLYFVLIALIAEYVTNIMRVKRKNRTIAPGVAFNVMRLRLVYEWGILRGNLTRGRLTGIGERFSYDGNTSPGSFRLNRYKIVKLVIFAIAAIFIVLLG